MVEQDHVQKLEEGADAWNAWRRTDSEVVPDLSDHDFEDQNVHGFDFTGADLRGADLSQVKRLLPASLAAANLSGSKLPEDLAEFPALDHVAEVSKHARVNFLAVVAGCVFCWLTIAQTSDGALLANIGQMPLPVINTKVPVSGFFLFAPAILLALYVYLQLYLQRMWDGLAGLPAVFSDGARLDEKAFPWLLSGLVNYHIRQLKGGAPAFSLPQYLLSLVAAWLLVPATIGWFWWRYLLVTNEWGVAPHALLLALSVAFGILFYRRAGQTLRRRKPESRSRKAIGFTALCIGVSALLTYGIRNATEIWHLDFAREEIRTKAEIEALEGKNKGKINREALTPLVLHRANLRHARGNKAFLVGVDLQGADIRDAVFEDADLRHADFRRGRLDRVNLTRAKLTGAFFGEMELIDVQLTGAVLDEASLGQACGRGSSQHQFLKPCEDAKSTRKPAAAKPEPTDKPPVTPLPPPAKPKPRPPAQVASRGPDASLKPDETFSDCADCPAMVVIPASGFVMGSPKDEKGRWTNEGPQRPVKIASSFAVGKFEVTRGEFAQFVKDENYDAGNECWTLEEGKGENRTGRNWRNPGFEQTDRDPVVCVNWNDAKAYVAWLSEKTKQPYRLLSEAEWEYMARGGTTTSRFWGNADEGCEYANAADLTAKETHPGWTTSKCRDGYLHTSPVGRFKANAFGVHDVLGNVWEWVEDVWHDSYEGAPDDGSAWTESGNQSLRVLRGGSWGRKPEDLRSAIRGRDGNGFRGGSFGFRVSRTLSR